MCDVLERLQLRCYSFHNLDLSVNSTCGRAPAVSSQPAVSFHRNCSLRLGLELSEEPFGVGPYRGPQPPLAVSSQHLPLSSLAGRPHQIRPIALRDGDANGSRHSCWTLLGRVARTRQVEKHPATRLIEWDAKRCQKWDDDPTHEEGEDAAGKVRRPFGFDEARIAVNERDLRMLLGEVFERKGSESGRVCGGLEQTVVLRILNC